MSAVDFGAVLEQLYPEYDDDVRTKLFALMCDVAFVYASSDEDCGFDLSLDCALDAVAENVHAMRAEHVLGRPSLLPAVAGPDNGGVEGDT